MKLTELLKDLTEVLKYCKEDQIDPYIWIENKGEIKEIRTIRLEQGLTEDNIKIGNLIFITREED